MKHLLGACALLSLLAGCASTDTVDPHGYDKTGVASYYGAKHQGKRTANGERFNMNSMTAAHRQLPFGTRVKVTNLNNDKSCVVRINDRGPHTRGRLIDLSKEAAERLQAEVGKLQSTAQGGDEGAIKAQIGAVGKACGNCHDNFRVKQ